MVSHGPPARLSVAEDDDDEACESADWDEWEPSRVRSFSQLLRDNTVLLQSLRHYRPDDPIHELKQRALEAAVKKLKLPDMQRMHMLIHSFKKFALTKHRALRAAAGLRRGPGAAPRWLRLLEPYLDLSDSAEEQMELELQEGCGWARSRLALALARRAFALRSLQPRRVVRHVRGLPAAQQDQLELLWRRMLDVVREKLSLLLAEDPARSSGVTLAAGERLLAVLLVLLDERLCTLPDIRDCAGHKALAELFFLVQKFQLERAPSALAWGRARGLALRHTSVAG